MTHARRLLLLSALVGLVGCTTTAPSPRTSLAESPPGSTTQVPTATPNADDAPIPALTVHDPTLAVTPSRGLVDGGTVVIAVTGFGEGGKVLLSECASAAVATSTGCGPEMAEELFLVTDEAEAGSSSFTVTADAFAGLPTTRREPCTDQCVIVATLGEGLPFLVAPIAFK